MGKESYHQPIGHAQLLRRLGFSLDSSDQDDMSVKFGSPPTHFPLPGPLNDSSSMVQLST